VHLRGGKVAGVFALVRTVKEDYGNRKVLWPGKASRSSMRSMSACGRQGGLWCPAAWPLAWANRDAISRKRLPVYRLFIRALLRSDRTTCTNGQGVRRPRFVRAHDEGMNPYPGGGCNKGLATFSAIANAPRCRIRLLAGRCPLLRAASGGYDPQELGIPAKGAGCQWQRPFPRELGPNVQPSGHGDR